MFFPLIYLLLSAETTTLAFFCSITNKLPIRKQTITIYSWDLQKRTPTLADLFSSLEGAARPLDLSPVEFLCYNNNFYDKK